MTEWRVPLSDIDIGEDEIEAVAEVIRSRWLTMGPKTEQLEHAFASLHKVNHAIALSSCTAALHLAYKAVGIEPGDDVIMPAMTFVATANTAVACGARPVFADIISEDEPTVDPDHVTSLITRQTRAIVVVHYAGYSCKMKEIMRVADRHDIPVIEDCAHAPGVLYEGRHLGTFGQIGCFSFFSNKNMTTGEGGMAVTADREIAKRMALLRSHGMTSGTWNRHNRRPTDYDVLEAGWNYRIDEMRSAIGLAQLKKLLQANADRRELTARYRRQMECVEGARITFGGYVGDSSCHILPLIAANSELRAAIAARLDEARVQTSHHYSPVHLFKLYREQFACSPGQLPVTEGFASKEITLPLYSTMKASDLDYVAGVIRDALQDAASKTSRVDRAS